MRSSRRKRSQYVITLREEVAGLQRRRREAQEERALLGQLTHLWQRLCDEVEAEIQEGVRRQLGIQVGVQNVQFLGCWVLLLRALRVHATLVSSLRRTLNRRFI